MLNHIHSSGSGSGNVVWTSVLLTRGSTVYDTIYINFLFVELFIFIPIIPFLFFFTESPKNKNWVWLKSLVYTCKTSCVL